MIRNSPTVRQLIGQSIIDGLGPLGYAGPSAMERVNLPYDFEGRLDSALEIRVNRCA